MVGKRKGRVDDATQHPAARRWRTYFNSLSARLAVAFVALVSLFAASAVVSGWEASHIAASTRQVVEVNLRRSELAHQLLHEAQHLSEAVRDIVLMAGSDGLDGKLASLKQWEVSFNEVGAQLKNSIDTAGATPAETATLDAVLAAAKTTMPALRRATKEAVFLGDPISTASTLEETVRPAEKKLRAAVEQLIALESELGNAAALQARQSGERMIAILLLATGLGAAAATAIAVYMIRTTSKALGEAIAVAERISGDDLTQDVTQGGMLETARLMSALATMQDRLRAIVGDIRIAADQIRAASSEVSTGNHDLSQRTEMAAASVQSAASAVNTINEAMASGRNDASQAAALASEAARLADMGGKNTQALVRAMSNILEKSQQVADATTLIDQLAFQTNLLSLNAAVEAAHAGDQGRGFSIVANEVRALAARSTAAAKSIKATIDEAQALIDDGNRRANDGGEAMKVVVESASRATSAIDKLARAFVEQSDELEGVNQLVSQLDDSTQQNAALVEQSTAAAEHLNAQAVRLNNTIATFKLPAGMVHQASV